MTKRLQKYGGFFSEIRMSKAITFIREVRAELSKIVWPTREQTIRYTVLVVIVAVASGLFLGGLDYGLTLLTDFLLKNFGR